jgi:hypothetical protein
MNIWKRENSKSENLNSKQLINNNIPNSKIYDLKDRTSKSTKVLIYVKSI